MVIDYVYKPVEITFQATRQQLLNDGETEYRVKADLIRAVNQIWRRQKNSVSSSSDSIVFGRSASGDYRHSVYEKIIGDKNSVLFIYVFSSVST